MEKLENQQPVEIFDIKRQMVEKLDEKSVEDLQTKLLVPINAGSPIPNIMNNNWITSSNYDRIAISFSAYLRFPYFLKQLENWVDQYWRVIYECSKTRINSLNAYLFIIKQAFIKDWKYFFYTSDGQILTANKSDFDANGINAQSLEFYWNQWDSGDVRWKAWKSVYTDWLKAIAGGDWFIHFHEIESWKNKLDIPWDNIFQIETSSIMISNWWSLQKYKIANNWSYKQLETFNIDYKWITQMVVDNNRNFIFIVNETDEWSVLHIILYDDFVDKHEINEVYSIKNVKEICWFWRENWMICLMNDDSLWYYRHTFSKFRSKFFQTKEDWTPWGKLIYPKEQEVIVISDSGKNKLLESLGNWDISIEIDEDEIIDEGSKLDKDLENKIWELPIKIWEDTYTLRQLFEDANDESSITKVSEILWRIKRNPEISKVPWIIRNIEKEINDKKNKIVLASLYSELWEITTEVSWVSDLATLITIKEKLKSIQKKRRNIAAWVVEKDKELKELLEIVNQKIKDYQEAHKEELEQEIEDNLVRIKEILDDIDNAIDVSSIIESEIYKTTYDMIYNLEPSLQSTYKKKLNDLILARKKTIGDIRKQEKEQEQQIIERNKNEILENIELIRDILEDIDDIVAVEQYEQNDALVQKVREQLSQIPSAEAQKMELKMQNIFRERIFSLRFKGFETKWVIQNLDSYGIDTALYYNEDGTESVERKIEWKEKPNWIISLVVKLVNWETHEYDKSLYLKDFEKYWSLAIWDKWIKFDMTEEEFAKFSRSLSKWKKVWKEEIKWLLQKIMNETDVDKKQQLQQQLKEKKAYYKDARYAELLINRLIKQQKLNPRSKVPPFDPDYIVLDEEKEILKELSARLVDQKHNSWIEILEWWPWLWKTVMCEFLAQVTNREIIRVQCSKMDPSDMFFSPTLKKWETSREPADWIKLMQKPGTIILFDEIDKLNDQCFERLHSLFDRSRSVYDPQLWKFKANPDCLFLWTRNSYDRLSNPIISRWRILQINYPGELNESYKISKYADNPILKKLSYEEFVALYEKYIIRQESVPTNAQEKNIYNLIINIKHLLDIFTELRKQYDSDDPFIYELSYRDARQIFVDYNWWVDFKKALENVLIPKARAAVVDKDDKATQEEMVQRAIDIEMG